MQTWLNLRILHQVLMLFYHLTLARPLLNSCKSFEMARNHRMILLQQHQTLCLIGYITKISLSFVKPVVIIHSFQHLSTNLLGSTTPPKDPLCPFCCLVTYFTEPPLIFNQFVICIADTLVIKFGHYSSIGSIFFPITNQP